MENINSEERQYLLDSHPNRELIEEEILNLCEKISNTRDRKYISDLLRFIDDYYIKNYIKNLFYDEYTNLLDGWFNEELYPKIGQYIIDAFKEAGIEIIDDSEEIEDNEEND